MWFFSGPPRLAGLSTPKMVNLPELSQFLSTHHRRRPRGVRIAPRTTSKTQERRRSPAVGTLLDRSWFHSSKRPSKTGKVTAATVAHSQNVIISLLISPSPSKRSFPTPPRTYRRDRSRCNRPPTAPVGTDLDRHRKAHQEPPAHQAKRNTPPSRPV